MQQYIKRFFKQIYKLFSIIFLTQKVPTIKYIIYYYIVILSYVHRNGSNWYWIININNKYQSKNIKKELIFNQ